MGRRASTEGPPVVLSVGRLVEKKGHETLLRAAALVRERGRDFRLRIVGEGVEWARLQRLGPQLGLSVRETVLWALCEAEGARAYRRALVFPLAGRVLEHRHPARVPY